MVVEPHTKTALKIESLSGDDLGPVAPLDKTANLNRRRQRPHSPLKPALRSEANSVELALEEYSKHYSIPVSKILDEEK